MEEVGLGKEGNQGLREGEEGEKRKNIETGGRIVRKEGRRRDGAKEGKVRKVMSQKGGRKGEEGGKGS